MQADPNPPQAAPEPRAERAIVLQLLDADHDEQLDVPQLREKLSDIDQTAFERALTSLVESQVIYHSGHFVWAAGAARHLDELALIGV